jgi:hypothetical protein
MKYGPLTCKQLSTSWGIPVTKTTQAFDPWVLKLGALLLDHPVELMATAAAAAEAVREQRDAEAQTLFDSELSERIARQTGKANRSIAPQSVTSTHQ